MSTTIAPVSISNALLSKIHTWDDTSEEWRLLVKDHKEKLKTGSDIMALDPDVIQEYLYRPHAYLSEHLKRDKALTWIFMYLNDLVSNIDFNRKLSQVFVPTYNQISNLRSTYTANLAARRKNI